MQDCLTHAVGVLLPLVLALTHVYIRYDFAPPCLHVELREFLLADGLLPQVLAGPLKLLLLLFGEVLLELPSALGLARLLLLPLAFLSQSQATLLSLSRFWMRSSSSRMRLAVSSSSKSLKSFSSGCAWEKLLTASP